MNADEVGAAFLDALTKRDFVAARALVAGDVQCRMLLPSGLTTESEADGTIDRFVRWFGDADAFEVEASNSGEVEGRATITYRVRLRDADGWQAIEQHLMLDVDPVRRIEAIDLLCSGFRSIATEEAGATVHQFDAGDRGCADGLAGEFRRRMQQIPVGHVLMVSTRDPAAKEDLPPLARMMGHVVRSVEAPGDGRLVVSVERGR
jgi:TusA-related sulfurtransferase